MQEENDNKDQAPNNEPLLPSIQMPLTTREKRLIYAGMSLFSFGIGANEFSAAGLLPLFVQDFRISYTQAAYAQAVYAFTVFLTGLPITALVLNKPRKKTLCSLMALFVAGSITSALAPNFPILILGRILSAFPHATFYATSFVIANSMSPGEEATSIALVYSGLTLANIAGTPAATALGQRFGRQFPFWLLAVVGTSGCVTIMASAVHKVTFPNTTLRQELAELKKIEVLLGSLATALGFGGMIAFSSYIAPIMIDITGFDQSDISWIMIIFGTALTLGNYLGGKAADRALMSTLYGSLIGLAATLGGLVFIIHYPLPSLFGVFALGIFGFGTVAPLTRKVTDGAGAGSLLIRASTNVSFNLGIAFSVWVAGLAIDAGFGYESTGWVGAILTTTGLVMAVASNCKGQAQRLFNTMIGFFGFGQQQATESEEISSLSSIQATGRRLGSGQN